MGASFYNGSLLQYNDFVCITDGAEPVGSEPEVFRQYLLADLAKWAKLVKESGAKLD